MNKSYNSELRAALYARVSSEEQVEGYSIDAQRRAFQSLCQTKGWVLFREYIEEGKSARTENINKRPVFKEVTTDALNKQFDVLVVHKVDRFSRKLRITLEYFDKLSKADVGFVSIMEQMDFSTPWGKFALSMLGALAELYSDNLSQETKKGWHERRKQGLYCGTLPFGAMKNEGGIPIPDMQERKILVSGKETIIQNYDGLNIIFELATQGKSDKEVAVALNALGYRTTGTQGSKPFSKDTIKDILKNKFYLGYIPDGNGDWIGAQHKAFISEEIWNQAQESRERNRKMPKNKPAKATISSITGIAYCWYCKGRIHVGSTKNEKRRMFCYNRTKGWKCQQKSTLLEVYEHQIEKYLETFYIPDDYQSRILEAHRKLEAAYDDKENKKAELDARLKRIQKMFHWGDLEEDAYLEEKADILRELQSLAPLEGKSQVLDRLADFLKNVASAWKYANQEQRNRLARQLFEEIWVKDKQVVAVKPRADLESFFRLSYEDWLKKFESERPIPPEVASNILTFHFLQ